MKPQLACDVDFKKLKFPVMLFPKIDGVRALNLTGSLVARSGKPFKNKLNTERFSLPEYTGFDGEMTTGNLVGSRLCNETTSALNTINGDVLTYWCLFDYITEEIKDMDYLDRYNLLQKKVQENNMSGLGANIWVIPYKMCHNEQDIIDAETHYLLNGYEGVILRNPEGKYKYGRCTPTESNYLRLKRFMDAEIVVTEIREGQTNNNEATLNPNGYTERSTHSENMVGNGMVGTIIGTALNNIEFNGEIVIRENDVIEVAPGKMLHNERQHYFQNQHELIGKIVKYQFFPIGIKDKPRFPTFQSIRAVEDM